MQEIIVVDGDSTDNTPKLVKQNPIAKLIFSEKGRARQINTGAGKASGEILYFLNPDAFPPVIFDKFIVEKIQKNYREGCGSMTLRR